jgi:hypothetical protein
VPTNIVDGGPDSTEANLLAPESAICRGRRHRSHRCLPSQPSGQRRVPNARTGRTPPARLAAQNDGARDRQIWAGTVSSIAAMPGQVGNPPGERRTEQFPPLPRPLTVQPVQTREAHGHFVVGVQVDHTILWALLATASAATGEFIGGELRLCRSHRCSLAPGCSLGTTTRAAELSLSILSPTWRPRGWSSTRLTAYRVGVLP